MFLFINEFKNNILKVPIYKCYPFLVIIFKKQIRTLIFKKTYGDVEKCSKHPCKKPVRIIISTIQIHDIDDNMIEVEVKAKISSFNEIEKKLYQIGAEKTKVEFQEDIYFNSPIVDFAKTDEALRIRTTKEDDNTNIFITYKGPKIDKKSKTRREIEMGIADSSQCSDIFEAIGFEKVRTVRKNRQYFSYENFEISLDDIEGLDPYMEIEISLEDGQDYSEAQNSIFKLFEKLGITEGFERTSYLELLEKLNND